MTTPDVAAHVLRELLHELRTPLAALSAFDAMSDTDIACKRAHTTAVDHMRALVTRAARTLTAIESSTGAAASNQPGERTAPGMAQTLGYPVELEETTVDDVFADTADLLSAEDPHGRIRLTGLRERRVLVDRVALSQILINLLRNALRFAPADTLIEVRVDGDATETTITVCDQGPGVSAELGERVFERGVGDGNGSGIGLHIARALAATMRGHLGLGSQHDGGCLVLSLPAVTEPGR